MSKNRDGDLIRSAPRVSAGKTLAKFLVATTISIISAFGGAAVALHLAAQTLGEVAPRPAMFQDTAVPGISFGKLAPTDAAPGDTDLAGKDSNDLTFTGGYALRRAMRNAIAENLDGVGEGHD